MRSSIYELEEQILGVALTTTGAIRDIVSLIPRPNAFQSETNQTVYAKMMELAAENHETDLVTVNYHLVRQHGPVSKKLGMPWMNILTSYLPAAKEALGNLMLKCVLLQQEHVRVAFATQLSRFLVDVQDVKSDPLQLMDDFRNWLDTTSDALSELSETPFSETLMKVVDRAVKAAEMGTAITGLPTGLAELDNYLKGLQPSTLTILAARPAMGKTAEACQIAYNLAVEQRIPVAFFSLEMSPEQLATRQLAIDTSIKNSHITAGVDSFGDTINIDRLRRSAKMQGDAPLWVYSRMDSIVQIKAKVSQLVSRHKIKLVIVDYLQLVESGSSRVDFDNYKRITYVSRELKKIARRYDIPVLALAQLSRKVEERSDKRPQLSDLKESGAIEQDADNVVFLYRPGYYSGRDKDGAPVDMNLLANIVAKNRQGSTHVDDEAIELHYDMSTNQISNYRMKDSDTMVKDTFSEVEEPDND